MKLHSSFGCSRNNHILKGVVFVKFLDIIAKRAFLTAFITVFMDFLFHYFFTSPMETMTYFVVKFLLAFFIASFMFSLPSLKKKYKISIISSLIFSALMSIYYRAWEIFEVEAPFGSRAPDIYGISREFLLEFSATWYFAHALFFVIGSLVSIRFIRK